MSDKPQAAEQAADAEPNLTSVQVGRFCGISERTIRDWQKKKIIPKSSDMSEIVKAIVAHQKTQVKSKKSKPNDLEAAKIRLTNLQADKLELEIEERRGTVVNSDEVSELWAKYIYASKNRLTGMPAKLAHELSGIDDPKGVKQVLERAVDEVLRELSSE